MLNHKKIFNQLEDFLDGRLSPEDANRVITHIQACPICAEELEALRSLLVQTDDLPEGIEPPRDLWPEIEARLDEPAIRHQAATPQDEIRQEPRPFRQSAFWLLAAMLAFALLLPPSLATFRSSGDTGAQLSAHSETIIQDYRTVMNGNRERIPQDGDEALDNSVSLIEKALQETGRAMKDLNSGSDQYRSLAIGYQKKLDILQRIAIRTATR